jgi:uncharacterized protein (TIGR02646 family)
MIRVNKAAEIPSSLCSENCNHYDGQDVQETLYSDQHGKCYLCEQETHKDYQIEHLRAKAEGFYPDLEFSWTNLFLVCGYCNGRKPNTFEIIDPTANNIEDLIIHRIDFYSKKVEFQSQPSDINTQHTIDLLTRLFNGKSQIRDKRGQILYKDLNREISNFLEMLLEYKSYPNEENKQIVIDLLYISKEFLGFKYWIIKDSGFYDEFKDFMIWNKLN